MSGKIRNWPLVPPSNRNIAKRSRRAAETKKTPVVALAVRLFMAGAFVIGQPLVAEPTPDIRVPAESGVFAALQDFVQTQRVVSLGFAQPPGGEQASPARDPYSVLSDFIRVADASGWVPLPAQTQSAAPDDASTTLAEAPDDAIHSGLKGAAPDDAVHAGLRADASVGEAYSALAAFAKTVDASATLARTPDDAIHSGLNGGAPDDAIHAGLRADASGGEAYSALAAFAKTVDASATLDQAPHDAIHPGLKGAATAGSDDYSALRDFAQSMDAAAPNSVIAGARPQAADAESNLVVAQAAKPVKTKKPSPAADEDAYAKNDPQVCMGCHGQDPHIQSFLKYSSMARKGDQRTPMAGGGCESCHGPSAAHVASRSQGGDVEPAVVFSGPHASPVEQRNEQCINCHEGGQRINWLGSKMQNDGVACVNCHTVHVAKDPVLVKKTQPEVCFACHAQQRAESFEYSHHPIQEGLVVCSDCHNPHGSPGPHSLNEFSVNETCYNCHQDKRGPMLWEHQPVREDCTNCHTPHGSVEERLLRENPGFMCSSCHSSLAANHSGGAFGGANALPGNLLGKAVFNSALGNQRLCLNCHSQIHGSNSPNGAYFFR